MKKNLYHLALLVAFYDKNVTLANIKKYFIDFETDKF